MTNSSFGNFLSLRESAPVTAKIKLQKAEGSNEFAPFTVGRTVRANLRPVIKAFADSGKVGLGYTTIDKTKGETEPQLKKKSLWLTGGAVRDHLKGKTPRNYDLATDATPSEIRLILTKAEDPFVEVRPREGQASKYAKLPPAGAKSKIFYASHWDKAGKEIEITAEVNGEKFAIATLGKHSKNRKVQPDSAEPAASVEEDAAGRDFTINAMYIPLTQHDGDNSELIDPLGGAHHLKNNEMVPVADFGKNLASDASGGLRYLQMVSRFGDGKIPDKHAKIISMYKDMAGVPKGEIRQGFVSGLEHPDIDPRKYLAGFASTGLLDSVVPGGSYNDDDAPDELPGDRHLASAWVARGKDPAELKKALVEAGWSPQEANDIAYLVKMHQWGKGGFGPDDFYDMKQHPNGLPKSKIRAWMQMNGVAGPELDSFLSFDDSDLRPYVMDGVQRSVNPAYVKHLGRSPYGHEFEGVRRHLTTQKWADMMSKK